jgi:hypothetical protein
MLKISADLKSSDSIKVAVFNAFEVMLTGIVTLKIFLFKTDSRYKFSWKIDLNPEEKLVEGALDVQRLLITMQDVCSAVEESLKLV